MITPMAMSMFATNLAYNSAGAMFGVNQSRMALANSASPTSDASSLASYDKALALQGAAAQTNYQASQAMFAGAENLKKKNQEQRERMLQNGVLFF